jgi:hypothetical protein
MTAALRDPFDWSARPRRFPVIVDCAMPPGDEPCTQVQCRYHLAHMGLGDHRRHPTRDCTLAVAKRSAAAVLITIRSASIRSVVLAHRTSLVRPSCPVGQRARALASKGKARAT